jgi:hypothetical protein
MASYQGTQPQHPFLATHSADENLMIIPFQIQLLTPVHPVAQLVEALR